MEKITLEDFLKRYTAVSEKFINEYFKFYKMCENNIFGIELDDVIEYLNIAKKDKFIQRLRSNFIPSMDYIIKKVKIKLENGSRNTIYLITFDTFEKICLTSKSKKANQVRDYFVTLRKFIDYYRQNLHKMFREELEKNTECIYIILIDKRTGLFKIGKSVTDLRNRLRQYITGTAIHPDIRFIMLVNDSFKTEKCIKVLLKEYEFKPNHEVYKVDPDLIKQIILMCAQGSMTVSKYSKKEDLENLADVNGYVIYDNIQNNIQLLSSTISSKKPRFSKKSSKRSSKKSSKKLSKKSSKRSSKKSSKRSSKKSSKKLSKKSSKRSSKK